MDGPLSMRTPDGVWTLRGITNRTGAEVYLVRQRIRRGSSVELLGTFVATLEQAATLMGDAFDLLTAAPTS